MAISTHDYERIVRRAADPHRPNSKANRLDKLLRNPPRSEELVIEWIEEQACKCLAKGLTITPALLTSICNRISLEVLIHKGLDVPIRLVRAASRYGTLRARIEQETGHVDPRMEPLIWNRAIDRYMREQQAKLEEGSIKTITTLPYADGTSPVTGKPLAGGGLHGWRQAIGERSADRMLSCDSDQDWLNASHEHDPDGTFRPDAQWMQEHGITRQMAMRLTDGELEAMGIDPRAWHDADPRGRDEKTLAMLLGIDPLAAILHHRHPGDPTGALATLGCPTDTAVTLVEWARLRLDHPAAGREDTWTMACRATHSPMAGADGLRAAERMLQAMVDRVTWTARGIDRLTGGVADQLAPVLGDARKAQRLADRHPGMGAADILETLGIDPMLARTGLAYQRLRGRHPGMDPRSAWARAAEANGWRDDGRGLSDWLIAIEALRPVGPKAKAGMKA